MVFELVVTIAINDICRHRVILDRWHDFDVNFVPATGVKAGAIPVGEEGSDCSLSIRCLHASHELAVVKFLVGGDRATLKVGLGESHHS